MIFWWLLIEPKSRVRSSTSAMMSASPQEVWLAKHLKHSGFTSGLKDTTSHEDATPPNDKEDCDTAKRIWLSKQRLPHTKANVEYAKREWLKRSMKK